jgi:hypothetical protein
MRHDMLNDFFLHRAERIIAKDGFQYLASGGHKGVYSVGGSF